MYAVRALFPSGPVISTNFTEDVHTISTKLESSSNNNNTSTEGKVEEEEEGSTAYRLLLYNEMMQRWKHAKTQNTTHTHTHTTTTTTTTTRITAFSRGLQTLPRPPKIHISQPHILSRAPAAVNLNPNKPIKTLQTQPFFFPLLLLSIIHTTAAHSCNTWQIYGHTGSVTSFKG